MQVRCRAPQCRQRLPNSVHACVGYYWLYVKRFLKFTGWGFNFDSLAVMYTSCHFICYFLCIIMITLLSLNNSANKTIRSIVYLFDSLILLEITLIHLSSLSSIGAQNGEIFGIVKNICQICYTRYMPAILKILIVTSLPRYFTITTLVTLQN